jgi:hypothetical protein
MNILKLQKLQTDPQRTFDAVDAVFIEKDNLLAYWRDEKYISHAEVYPPQAGAEYAEKQILL